MAIPTFERKHVEAAIHDVDQEGVPVGRAAKKFALVVNGRQYPPKYIVSLAVRHATGRALEPSEFGGGVETNRALQALGFTIMGFSKQQPLAPRFSVIPLRSPETQSNSVGVLNTAYARSNTEASLARLVCKGKTPDAASALRKMLCDAVERLPGPVKFLLTPGGFVRGDFPPDWCGQSGWESTSKDARSLIDHAEKVLDQVVTPSVLHKCARKVSVLTIGIDLFHGNDPEHIELVAIYDVHAGHIVRWTGKSYPTGGQQASLVQIVDLESHLLDIAGERILVLGCFDLNMWSPRVWATVSPHGPRKKRCAEMRKLARSFQPTIVLQHPHSTDTANIWAVAWSGLHRELPSVSTWASGIAFFNPNSKVRKPLDSVLKRTRGNGSNYVDVILRSADYK